jgi:hypothetical protein
MRKYPEVGNIFVIDGERYVLCGEPLSEDCLDPDTEFYAEAFLVNEQPDEDGFVGIYNVCWKAIPENFPSSGCWESAPLAAYDDFCDWDHPCGANDGTRDCYRPTDQITKSQWHFQYPRTPCDPNADITALIAERCEVTVDQLLYSAPRGSVMTKAGD